MGIWQLVSSLILGFILGLKHALEADHVLAVSTIVSQTKSLKKSTLVGAMWGLGHTTTLFLIGLLLLSLKISIPNKLSLFFELLIGIILVILGFNLLKNSKKNHVHEHQHGGEITHSHSHTHLHHYSKSYSIGLIHGLAGSSALTLLVLSSSQTLLSGLWYILVFGIGSIFGMLVLTTIIGLPFLLAKKLTWVDKTVRTIAGLLSVLLGVVIIFEILPVLSG